MKCYAIDSNVFIQGKNFHYGFDFCPAFWHWLIKSNDVGIVVSIEKVLDELNQQSDELTTWANERSDGFFRKPSDSIISAHNVVSDWAKNGKFTESAIRQFLRKADSWLIAYAITYDCYVVTHEVPGSKKQKIKIPDVCEGLSVECMDPFQMLRRERPRFILELSEGTC